MQFFHRYSHLKPVHWRRWFIGGVLMAWIATILCLSSVPPVSRDALTHHLRVPQLYVDAGGIIELPEIEFSYYPMNLDLLYLLPLLSGNDTVPKYIHFFFALLTAWMLFGYLRERLGEWYAVFGVFFFLSLPIIVKLSITVYVDLGIAFFYTAAIVHLFRWTARGYARRHLITAAIFCGLALGTKYNSLIGFILLSGAIPFLLKKGAKKQHVDSGSADSTGPPAVIISTVVFVIVSLIVFSPWMVRNILWTGNPLFPLFSSLFNPHTADASPHLTPFALRHWVYGESFWQIATVPLRIFFAGQDNDPQLFDGRLSPFLLLLPAITMLQLPTDPFHVKREKLFLCYFVVCTILIVFFKHDMRIRYLVPVLPPLVILSTMGLRDLFLRYIPALSVRNSVRVGGIVILSLVVLGFNMPYLATTWQHVDPFNYLSGELSRDGYIEKHRPEYALFKYANRELDAEAKIQGLFLGNRGYYCKRQIIFDIPGFKRRLESASNAAALKKSLTEEGITHLMINEGLFIPWLKNNLEAEAQQVLASFLSNHTRSILYTDKGYRLLLIKPQTL